MLEIKTFFGDWREVTREVAENFYNLFCEKATAINSFERRDYFNKNHIRGGHVLLNGKIETEEEKTNRMFQSYKNNLVRLYINHGRLRFACIEYVCSFPKINPYEMAASLIKDGIEIVYNDSSISKTDNIIKERKVNKLLV